MRTFSLATAFIATALAAPGALACHPTSLQDVPPVLPPAYWSEAPPASDLEPGEVAIRATFKRPGTALDSQQIDYILLAPPPDIIIITCTNFPVFTVLDVLAGDGPRALTEPGIVVYPHILGALSFTSSQVLVGRLFPLRTRKADGTPPSSDAPRYMFIPRPPPEAPLNVPHK